MAPIARLVFTPFSGVSFNVMEEYGSGVRRAATLTSKREAIAPLPRQARRGG
jgi:hypothetical protein